MSLSRRKLKPEQIGEFFSVEHTMQAKMLGTGGNFSKAITVIENGEVHEYPYNPLLIRWQMRKQRPYYDLTMGEDKPIPDIRQIQHLGKIKRR